LGVVVVVATEGLKCNKGRETGRSAGSLSITRCSLFTATKSVVGEVLCRSSCGGAVHYCHHLHPHLHHCLVESALPFCCCHLCRGPSPPTTKRECEHGSYFGTIAFLNPLSVLPNCNDLRLSGNEPYHGTTTTSIANAITGHPPTPRRHRQ
jgi:hypothetical protein